jgi:hypothetical protein
MWQDNSRPSRMQRKTSIGEWTKEGRGSDEFL